MRKTIVQYPGVDVRRFAVADGAGFRQQFATPERPCLIGLVGRVHYRKGQDYFLDALYHLKQHGVTGVRALIIGDIYPGYEAFRDALHRKTRELGLAEDVVFCGHRDAMESVYPALDLVVAPSTLPEAFSLVVAEAMAAGRPVIATALGGPSELIEDGVSGLLIPTAQPRLFGDCLERLLRDPDLRTRLGQAARQRIETFFSAEAFDRRVRSLAEEWLCRCRGQAGAPLSSRRMES